MDMFTKFPDELAISMRPHQDDALNWLRYGWKKHSSHIISANVGFGKTALSAKIIHGCAKNNMRCMFIAPYVVLVEQTANAFMGYGLPQPSIVWRDHPWYDPTNMVQIASADTLTARGMPDDIDVFIIDEAHIRREEMLKAIVESGAKYIALSGTPWAAWMSKYYESSQFIKVRTMQQMIDEGFNVPFDIYAPTTPDLKKLKRNNTGDYTLKSVGEELGKADIIGNVVGNWIENGEDRQTICFCATVKHANKVMIEFNKYGVNAEVVTGETPKDVREAVFQRYRDKVTRILVNVGVLVAGFDEDVRCVILAVTTKSEMKYIQMVGRGNRIADGKKDCLARDTLVLTDKGEVKIQDVTLDHKVWDGVEFVSHSGAVCKGVQNVITYDGITATPDHEVMTDDGWKTIKEAASKQLRIIITGVSGKPVRFSYDSIKTNRREQLQSIGSGSMQQLQHNPHGVISQHEKAAKQKELCALQTTQASDSSEVAIRKMPRANGQVQQPEQPSIREVRCERDRVQVRFTERCSHMDCGESRGEGQVTAIGQNRQRWSLRGWESEVGTPCNQHEQHESEHWEQGEVQGIQGHLSACKVCRQDAGKVSDIRDDVRADRGEMEQAIVQTEREVWDIHNAGRLQRFTANGRLVHNCLVFDHSGTVAELGLPTDIEYESLPSGKDNYTNTQQVKEKVVKKPKECTKCKYMKPIGVHECPKCGFAPVAVEEIAEAEGSLARVKGGKGKEPEDKQQWYSMLIGYYNQQVAEGKTWKEGWPSMQFNKKFGEWPNGLNKTPLQPDVKVTGWLKHQRLKYVYGMKKAGKI